MTVHPSQPIDTGRASLARIRLLEPVFTGLAKVVNILGIYLWLAALLYLWSWWLQSAHVHTLDRYAAVTIVLLWITLIPAYFVFLFASARVPTHRTGPPFGARVAVVVTKTPTEPFSVVRRTLEGALAQRGVVHDTWLADEDPSEETREWCRQHRVCIASRKGIAEYHRTSWPRRARTKEGNLAYFYDKVGYDRYDFVSQFDADHVPDPTYLQHALAPFVDPRVGYVSAPSICDSNAAQSWSARGRLYVEASMHGALQAGYNAGWAPLCIGSHYTVRTAALRSVGGLGPELAEDHSTTLMLNAGGWKGVHAINAIAHGEGPDTFTDLVLQEFQWSRSLVTILLRHSPNYISRLPAHLRFQFLFSELWYPLFSGFMAAMFLLPIVALASGEHFINVTYVDFFVHMLPLSLVLLVLAFWWRSTGMFRPADARIVTWEGVAFLFLRWPWSLIGSLAAVHNWWRGEIAGFRITPKGASNSRHLPFRVILPYVLLSLAAGLTALLVEDPGTAGGFYIFNLVNAAIYGALVVLVLYRHARENRVAMIRLQWSGLPAFVSVVAIATTILAGVYANGPKGLAAINEGIKAVTLTRTLYPVAGAGGSAGLEPTIRFRPRWDGFSGRESQPGDREEPAPAERPGVDHGSPREEGPRQ